MCEHVLFFPCAMIFFICYGSFKCCHYFIPHSIAALHFTMAERHGLVIRSLLNVLHCISLLKFHQSTLLSFAYFFHIFSLIFKFSKKIHFPHWIITWDRFNVAIMELMRAIASVWVTGWCIAASSGIASKNGPLRKSLVSSALELLLKDYFMSPLWTWFVCLSLWTKNYHFE